MSKHERFDFHSFEQLQEKIHQLNVTISLTKDVSYLHRQVKVGGKTSPNSLAILPMEGCDSEPDGSPSELVERRYIRFASGGAGLIWWEACAVVEEGRANPRQMMLTKANAPVFSRLFEKINKVVKSTSKKSPLHILQLTHSGRYSRPQGHKLIPLIPQHDPILDPLVGIGDDYPLVTDEYLDSLVEKYVKSAMLAQQIGFDGVDIKACHRYLLSELLASHTREGKYGGSFENRSLLLLSIIKEVKKAVGNDFIVASRFNIFDAHPYPYGFGEDRKDFLKYDLLEPLKLVKLMRDLKVELLSNSAGNPYYIYPQVTRPFDTPNAGIPIPDEHPLESIARLFFFTREIQKAAGLVPVVGNGYTWLRNYLPYAGSANIRDGSCSFLGLGRCAIAYPDAPRDILERGMMDPKKCCITCSKCTQIMRDHGKTGCVVRDGTVYGPLYKEARRDADARSANKGSNV